MFKQGGIKYHFESLVWLNLGLKSGLPDHWLIWFLSSMCLMSLHVTVVFCTLRPAPCALFVLSYCCSNALVFLKTINFFRAICLLFNVDYLDDQHCGMKSYSFSFILHRTNSLVWRTDSALSTVLFYVPFRTSYYRRLAVFFNKRITIIVQHLKKVAIYLTYIPLQVTYLIVSDLLINCIMPHSIRTRVLPTIFFSDAY